MEAPLLELTIQQGDFVVQPGNSHFWTVIRREECREGIRLEEGDVFRLGRTCFRVKTLCTEGNTSRVCPYYPASSPQTLPPDLSTFGLESQVCRICLEDFQSSSNPLISPCKCTGSMQFIHFNCLQEWVRSRLDIRRNGAACAYFWGRLECELCKAVLSMSVTLGDEVKDLLNVAIPQGAYVILEDLRSAGYATRGVHVVGMSGEGVCRFGRSPDCEVYISDASITRFHANIRIHKGGFYLEDLHSRFGTAVKTTKKLKLPLDIPTLIQTNNLIVTIQVLRKFQIRRLLCCLYGEEIEADVTERSGEKAAGHMNTLPGKGKR